MSTRAKFTRRIMAAALATILLPVAAFAWPTPPPAGSVGATPIITVPPAPMPSYGGTAGQDSTLNVNSGQGGVQGSSIVIPLPSNTSGGGFTPPPPPSCTPSQSTATQPAQCPSGETVGGAIGGATSFTQTSTISTTCNGSTPQTTSSPWSPTVGATCQPQRGGNNGNLQNGHCMRTTSFQNAGPQGCGWYIVTGWVWDTGNQSIKGNPAACTPGKMTKCGPCGPVMPATCGASRWN